ncbi:glutamate--tRNA ligase [Aliarcobacter cibarius]|jgi:glutamyl-tRNA synthetase|uniref:Glutamate--tRNA ligase n=1 Tax=Aliarcobacter cibarius TaxID=255507 RepID=A0A5J6RG38_9BACT|nr:glutamate--tRNA ligase [Aliarcobacter cibarius]QEZ89190.1 glutamyl-tRNA synthetase [Aliarcobacter cibarius]QKJ27225.1 glutamyl-tRNA synthetase [Aliarcobacter cibarius]TLT01556.1 glutamate--tRNA ligase [Aliarcobacter cibarius]TLT02047.1 glutamate--tRNA ligase [Aliarcobacter cibarius]TLT04111.1 glutamate--tRNA ligase [Aliarcobacter cibarius]
MLRFAPSPTGDMHIGNLRVAIFNYIVSKQLNEGLIIRIEDTDKARNIEGKDKEILEILNLFSIDYVSVFYQSDNLKYHQKMALQLMTQKKAFACFCSDTKLEELKEESIKKGIPFRYDGFCETLSDETVLNTNAPFTVRLKKPDHNIKFTDVLKGDFDYAPFDVDSFIILRQDKTPTYNYACSVDDMLMDISMVIRGEDHVSNTPKQIHIRESLGYTKEIKYVHLPIILNAQTGKKMSKRDDASSVKWLIEQGFLPSAIANYLVLIGNKTPTEIFTLEEAIKWFKIENVSKSGAKFDIDKLRFINRKHIEMLDEMRLSKILGFADENIGKLAKLYLEEASTIKEIKAKLDDIFSVKTTLEGFEEESKKVKEVLQKTSYFESYDDLKNHVTENTALKGKNLFKPLRYILTGVENGPNLADIYPFIKNYIGEIVR